MFLSVAGSAGLASGFLPRRLRRKLIASASQLISMNCTPGIRVHFRFAELGGIQNCCHASCAPVDYNIAKRVVGVAGGQERIRREGALLHIYILAILFAQLGERRLVSGVEQTASM